MTGRTRRGVLGRLGVLVAAGVAGCLGSGDDTGGDGAGGTPTPTPTRDPDATNGSTGSPTANPGTEPTPQSGSGSRTPTTDADSRDPDGTGTPTDGSTTRVTPEPATPRVVAPNQEGVAWRYDIGAKIDAAPTVADGRVYVGGWRETNGGTPTPGYDPGPSDWLFAFDAASGQRQWQYHAGGPVQHRPLVAGDRIYAVRGFNGLHGHGYQVHGVSPAGEGLWTHEVPSLKFVSVLGADESGVYVGTHDDNLGGGNERVTALAPGGAVRWQHEFSDVAGGVVGRDAAYAAGFVGRVRAYETESGQRPWTAESKTEIPEVVAEVGDVVVLRDEGAVGLDRASGEERWRFDRFEPVEVTVGGKLAYATGERGEVVALVATDGSVAWETTAGSEPPALAVADTTVYLCHGDGTLVARHAATGSEQWRRSLDAKAAPVPAGERVYAAWPDEGRARALSARTGEPGGEFAFDGSLTRIVPGGAVDVAATEGGAVYGLARE